MSTPPPPPVGKIKNRTGLAWQEFNSLPSTPPPVTEPPIVSPPVMRPPAPAKGKQLFVVAGAVAVAIVAGLFVFFPPGRPRVSPPVPVVPTAAAPAKPEEVEPTRPVVAEIPAEVPQRALPQPAKRPHVGVKPHPPQIALQPLSADTPADTKAVPATPPAEDFGMTLQRPIPRRPTKKIDETDPYAP
jgi:hypothetical protein